MRLNLMWHAPFAITSNLPQKSHDLEGAKVKSTATCSDVNPCLHQPTATDTKTPPIQPRRQDRNRDPSFSPGSERFKICSKLAGNHSRPGADWWPATTKLSRPLYILLYTSFYIHPSTSSKHPCVHPPSQTFRYQHSSCPTKAFGGKQWSNSFSRVSAFENMLKACNHSSPPTIEWCLVLLRFLPAGQPEFFCMEQTKSAMH